MSDTNLNDALFVTFLNKKLNDQKVPLHIVNLINEYIMTNSIKFIPTTSHNPYRVVEGLGIIELYSTPVDVTDPIYVEYVQSIRLSINTLSATIKILNDYIKHCEFNDWVDIGTEYLHNFHKLIAAIRNDVVFDYNALIDTRIFWKNIYKTIRITNTLSNQSSPTVH